MIIPRNDVLMSSAVMDKVADKENKTSLAMVAIVIGSVLVAIVAVMILSGSYNVPLGVAIFFAVVGVLLVLLFVFRFFIFHEQDRVQDEKVPNRNSLFRYIKVTRKPAESVKFDKVDYNILEFSSGQSFVVLELQFGSNDRQRAKGNEAMIKSIIHAANIYGMNHRMIIMSEAFDKSDEYHRYLKQISKIDNKVLRKYVTSIFQGIADVSKINAKTEAVYFEFISPKPIDSYSTRLFLTEINNCFGLVEKSSLRRVRSLKDSELFSWLQDYYGVDVIDSSLLSSMNNRAAEFIFPTAFHVTTVRTTEGRTRKNENVKFSMNTIGNVPEGVQKL